ncbi:MAG: hypothetical protein KDI44_04405 [Thiothrix sp.]|nr:hypothetical protein [Thiothrix sp.]HPQ94070.1 hypothetical protein [Thiolinea sp.]
MDIAYLACNRNLGPSWIYRCENPGLALVSLGHQVHCCHYRRFNPFMLPDVVVFHRPRWSLHLEVLVRWLQWRGVRVVADFDDLVFDPAQAAFSPGVLNRQLSLDKTRQQYLLNGRALALFNRVTVSTTPLREQVLALLPQADVQVLPNAVHWRWQALEPGGQADGERLQHPVITYLPGTRSHDRDFRCFADGLQAFLGDHPAVRLAVTGPLDFSLPQVAAQLVVRDKLPFAQFHTCFQDAWVNLAPLEPTPFTRCKSALKVMEAGWWGIPTLCSLTPDAGRFAGCGALPVQDGADLYRQLSGLLEPAYYHALSDAIRTATRPLVDVRLLIHEWLQWIQK